MLFADSWLAYKTTLVAGIGIYYLAMFQMTFKSGRPQWDVGAIDVNGVCLFDFGGPSQAAFIMTFFWPYIIIMFLCKYYKRPNKVLNWLLTFILLACWVDIYLVCLINGLNYIYQLVIG